MRRDTVRPARSHHRSEGGQILVIVAGGLLVLIAMVGLVIDGGYAWGQQRDTQNGADAAAKAGAGVIQLNLAGDPRTGGDVGCAIEDTATQNDIDVDAAVYTDHQGAVLASTVPACGSGAAIPAGAQGVRAVTEKEFETFLVSAIGFDDLTARATATAVVGRQNVVCPAASGCGVLPVTFPQVLKVCERDVVPPPEYTLGTGAWSVINEGDATVANMVSIPLCDTAITGSVGWLDLCGAPNLAAEIQGACNVDIPIPAWLETKPGNPNCCEDELNDYAGPTVNAPDDEDTVLQIPVHTNTCRNNPGNAVSTCPPPHGNWSGNGNNGFYYIPIWVGFKLDQAYVQGGDEECKQAPGNPVLSTPDPPGKVGCLKGWFVDLTLAPGSITTGVINPGDPTITGVLLIR
jgi:putative Flp pilus-assembly TadE/G-like protein